MRAMILSAGYGTRLWPLTQDRTKPALPILGKPLVGYVAEYLAKFGCDEIVVNLHHRPESVRRALGDGTRFGVKLTYVEEPVILGTSGALDNARDLLAQETFVVVNGKIITNIDLNGALAAHRAANAMATLVLLPNPARERFSVVATEAGRVLGFGGMPELTDETDEFAPVPLMFTGIQIVEPRIFDYIPRGVFSHSTTDVYPQAIAAGELVAAYVGKGKWYELSTLQRYLEISLKLLAPQNKTVFSGANSCIAPGAQVTDSILWDDVIVETNARISRAILGDGVRVTNGQVLENVAVVRASLVNGAPPPAKALRGELIGENFVVSLAQ